jgi:hypothetical protein
LHDAVQLERLGVPATVVITEPFVDLVHQFASTLGMPDYAVVTLPHPVSSKDDSALRQLAAEAAPRVASLLTTPCRDQSG